MITPRKTFQGIKKYILNMFLRKRKFRKMILFSIEKINNL